MKKIVLLLFITTLMASCASKQVITATKDSGGNLVGIANKELFQKEYGKKWFNSKYENYKPNAEIVKKIKTLLKGVTIKAFMGTWCGDSKRETPPFYKVLEAAGFKEKNITMVAMNRSKRYNGMENTYNVRRVPTFIFYTEDKELGRIVERRGARQSIEKDILDILSK